MLCKKELAALPVLKPACKDNAKYWAAAHVYELPRSGEILAVDIHEAKKRGQLFARFFTDGHKYIFQMTMEHANLKQGDWTERKVIRSSYGCVLEKVVSTETDLKIGKEFLQSHGYDSAPYMPDMGDLISSFIWSRGYEKRQKQWEREAAMWKKHTGMFPKYPTDLKTYCENHVFHGTTAFYSKLEKGNRKAVCCHCGKQFATPNGVRAKDTGVCPKCGKPVVFRQGWGTGNVKSKAKICIPYRVNDQLLLRYAKVTREVSPNQIKPVFHFEDFFLDLFLTVDAVRGKPTEYSYWYGPAPYCGSDWHRLKNDSSGCSDYTYLYTENLREVFGEKLYSVGTGLLKEQMDNLQRPIHVRGLMDNLKNLPQAEYLLKMGLPQLAAEYIDKDKRNFEEVVGISRQYLPILRETQANYREICVLAAYPRWVEPDTVRRLVSLDMDYETLALLQEIVKDVPISRALRYLEKQKQLSSQKKLTFYHLISTYRDYINMAKLLGADMRIKSLHMPPCLKERHEQLIQQANKKRCELEDAAMRKVIEDGLYWWAQNFGNKDFTVVYPQGKSDFIREGQCLNHCVGSVTSYFENHCKGTRMIFFIRRTNEPNKPYFTAEIDIVEYRIRQLYGFGDCSAPREVRQYTESFVRACARWRTNKAALGVSA